MKLQELARLKNKGGDSKGKNFGEAREALIAGDQHIQHGRQ
jgi:hypothetical protein